MLHKAGRRKVQLDAHHTYRGGRGGAEVQLNTHHTWWEGWGGRNLGKNAGIPDRIFRNTISGKS